MSKFNEDRNITVLSQDEIEMLGEHVVGGFEHTTFVNYAGLAVNVIALIANCWAAYVNYQTAANRQATTNNVMGNNNRGDTYNIFGNMIVQLSGSIRNLFATAQAQVNPNNGVGNAAAFANAQATLGP